MERRLLVYEWILLVKDEDFRKYKKNYILNIEVGELMPNQLGTELDFGNKNKARITKITVDMNTNIEYIEAVTLDKWV